MNFGGKVMAKQLRLLYYAFLKWVRLVIMRAELAVLSKYQLSAFSYQHSAISSQLSAVSYQRSAGEVIVAETDRVITGWLYLYPALVGVVLVGPDGLPGGAAIRALP